MTASIRIIRELDATRRIVQDVKTERYGLAVLDEPTATWFVSTWFDRIDDVSNDINA